jgi:hypothetical protein
MFELIENVIISPSYSPSVFGYHFDCNSLGSLDYAPAYGFEKFDSSRNFQHKPCNLYVLSDEKITGLETDIWVCDGNRVWLWENTMALSRVNTPRRVLMTSDQHLIDKGISCIDDRFLMWLETNYEGYSNFNQYLEKEYTKEDMIEFHKWAYQVNRFKESDKTTEELLN